jgi:hypothetical protein
MCTCTLALSTVKTKASKASYSLEHIHAGDYDGLRTGIRKHANDPARYIE